MRGKHSLTHTKTKKKKVLSLLVIMVNPYVAIFRFVVDLNLEDLGSNPNLVTS